MRLARLARLFVLIWMIASQADAQPAPDAHSAPTFDVNAAVAGYLAKLPVDKKARSDAYFEGGYWLQLWDFLYGAAVSVFLLASRFSTRMRDFAGRVTRFQYDVLNRRTSMTDPLNGTATSGSRMPDLSFPSAST